MARIVCKISCVAIFNLLYTSMFSDGITLIPYEDNPIVGRPFKLECNTETTIVATVNIKSPDDTSIGSCVPAAPPFPATCANAAGYEAKLNESLHTLRINTSSMASDVNGIWVCLHDGKRATYALASPLTEIKDEKLHLTPFTNNITTKPVSLTATYECINIPVYFKWFVEDNSSQKNPLDVVNTAEVNISLCTTYPGFNAYTQTYSTSSVKGLDGSYRIGLEVHYTGEVTALRSIQYFNTYFIFSSRGTNTPTGEDGEAIGILIGIVVITDIIVIAMVVIRLSIMSTGEISGNGFLTFCQFIKNRLFDCCGSDSIKKNFFLGFTYLVLYGVIVEVIVLLAVYYGYSEFQERLVIGVGFVIVLVLSGLCILVVYMLMKFVNNREDASRMKLNNHDELQHAYAHQMSLYEVERTEESSDC